MKTGNGKIANLPSHIRDELNWRINDGDEGKELVEWLNAKPEVSEVVTRLFDGKPISQQNLSQWRTHGYLRWHAYHVIMRETAELAGNSGDIKATGINCENMLWALKANYADMIQRWLVTPTDQMTYRIEVFKHLTAAVVSMDGAEIRRARLEILRDAKAGKSKSSEPFGAAESAAPAEAAAKVLAEAGGLGRAEAIAVGDDGGPGNGRASLTGLCEADCGPVAPEEREPVSSDEPIPLIAPSSSRETPTAENPEPVAQPRDNELVEEVEVAETPATEVLPSDSRFTSHGSAPRSDAAVAGLSEAGSAPVASEERQLAALVEPPSPQPFSVVCSPSDAPSVESAPSGESPEEKAPNGITEAPIDSSDDCNPQDSTQTAPTVARLSQPSQSLPHRPHRRGRQRGKSRFGQDSTPTPANRPVAPAPAPPTKPAASASEPFAQPTAPPSSTATASMPPAPQNVPLWPNHRPSGPPRNASSRNPFGLL
jgi:hypothetical protein